MNNAGIIRRSPAADYSEDNWDEVISVDLTAVFRLSELAARQMFKQATPGKILNIASVLSFQGGILVSAYAAAKRGVVQLTHAFANEWAARGINVNVIAPGYMATDNPVAQRSNLQPPDPRADSSRPLGRPSRSCGSSGFSVFPCQRLRTRPRSHGRWRLALTLTALHSSPVVRPQCYGKSMRQIRYKTRSFCSQFVNRCGRRNVQRLVV